MRVPYYVIIKSNLFFPILITAIFHSPRLIHGMSFTFKFCDGILLLTLIPLFFISFLNSDLLISMYPETKSMKRLSGSSSNSGSKILLDCSWMLYPKTSTKIPRNSSQSEKFSFDNFSWADTSKSIKGFITLKHYQHRPRNRHYKAHPEPELCLACVFHLVIIGGEAEGVE